MILVIWPRWPPCPYMLKTFKNLRNQKADDLETWYTASGTQLLPSLFKWWHGLTLTYFTARSNLVPYELYGKKVKQWIFMPRHQKVAGYYVIPSEILSVRPSVRPSVCLSVRPSVRPSISAYHHSCIGNSSYSFRPILLKLYRCFKDGLKICILFFQNPEIIFYHFFPIFNLDIFRALILQICIWSMYLVSATPPTVFGESFWNFTGVLRMVWRYAYCFFRILKLFFITFFAFLT